jgi:hypothetical protein
LSMETISESELRKICVEIYRDRFAIYDFNPQMKPAEAVQWMLLGCLISRLSITDEELQEASATSYAEAITKLLSERTAGGFDARSVVDELMKRVENES